MTQFKQIATNLLLIGILWLNNIFKATAEMISMSNINELSLLLYGLMLVFSLALILTCFWDCHKKLKLLIAVCVSFFYACDYVYCQISGHPLFLPDFSFILPNISLAAQSIKTYSLIFVKGIVIFAVLCWLIYQLNWHIKKFVWLRMMIMVFPVVVVLYQYNADLEKYIPAPYRCLGDIVWYLRTPNLKIDYAEPKIEAKKNSLQNIILVVDESVSGKAEYCEILQPYFEKDKLSCGAHALGNCTDVSRPYLRLAVKPGQDKTTIFQNTTLWQYAKKAGFETYYLGTGQVNTDSFYEQEAAQIDHVKLYPIQNNASNDGKIADDLLKILAQKQKKFIMVFKNGAHFYYKDAYPDSYKKYTPDMENSFDKDFVHVKNSYKNAIAYNAEAFLSVLKSHFPDNSILIYTSDHGQNLSPETIKGLNPHCSNITPHEDEFIVPIAVMGNIRLYKGELSHWQIVPSLLYFMGYDVKDIHDLHGVMLNEANKFNQAFFGDAASRLAPTGEYTFQN